MREKLINALEEKLLGLENDLGVKVEKSHIKQFAESLISTLIESLPEEEKVEDADYYLGRNSYRSEVINLLRGN